MVNKKFEIEEKDYWDFYASLVKEKSGGMTDKQIESYVEKQKKESLPSILQLFNIVNKYFQNFLSPYPELEYKLIDPLVALPANQAASIVNPIFVEANNEGSTVELPVKGIPIDAGAAYAGVKSIWDKIGEQIIEIAQKGVEFLSRAVIRKVIKDDASLLLPKVKYSVYIFYLWKECDTKDQLNNMFDTYARQYPNWVDEFIPAANPPLLAVGGNAITAANTYVNAAALKARFITLWEKRPKVSGEFLKKIEGVKKFNEGMFSSGIPRNIPGSGVITIKNADGTSIDVPVDSIKQVLKLDKKKKKKSD